MLQDEIAALDPEGECGEDYSAGDGQDFQGVVPRRNRPASERRSHQVAAKSHQRRSQAVRTIHPPHRQEHFHARVAIK